MALRPRGGPNEMTLAPSPAPRLPPNPVLQRTGARSSATQGAAAASCFLVEVAVAAPLRAGARH